MTKLGFEKLLILSTDRSNYTYLRPVLDLSGVRNDDSFCGLPPKEKLLRVLHPRPHHSYAPSGTRPQGSYPCDLVPVGTGNPRAVAHERMVGMVAYS